MGWAHTRSVRGGKLGKNGTLAPTWLPPGPSVYRCIQERLDKITNDGFPKLARSVLVFGCSRSCFRIYVFFYFDVHWSCHFCWYHESKYRSKDFPFKSALTSTYALQTTVYTPIQSFLSDLNHIDDVLAVFVVRFWNWVCTYHTIWIGVYLEYGLRGHPSTAGQINRHYITVTKHWGPRISTDYTLLAHFWSQCLHERDTGLE